MPTIHVNGVDLFYTQEGSGQPLLLLHGNGEDHTIFDKIMPDLAKDFTVYAFDTRGHGASSKVDTFGYQEMANDIVQAIGALGLAQSKPALYGFSDGGIVGLLVASQHPQLLGHLIVSGANINPSGLKKRWIRLFKVLYKFSKDAKIKMMLDQPDISIMELGKIEVPTLVLAGEKDMVSEAHTALIASSIPNSTLHILHKESHGSYVVKSPKLYPLITEFLLQ